MNENIKDHREGVQSTDRNPTNNLARHKTAAFSHYLVSRNANNVFKLERLSIYG